MEPVTNAQLILYGIITFLALGFALWLEHSSNTED